MSRVAVVLGNALSEALSAWALLKYAMREQLLDVVGDVRSWLGR